MKSTKIAWIFLLKYKEYVIIYSNFFLVIKQATEMVEYIHTEFIKSLEDVDWMDPRTKKRAIQKARGITARIGYAKEILKHVKVAELFVGVCIRSCHDLLIR